MFKFIRQYQSYLLVVGGSLLMIAFLIEPALKMFNPSREKAPIGRIDGKKITFGDQDSAGADLYVLETLGIVPGVRDRKEALAWFLALRDAQNHGLEVSQLEVNQMLALRGLDENGLKEAANRLRVSTGLIRRAIANWMLIDKYQELVLGLRSGSALERVRVSFEAQQLQNKAYAQITQAMSEGKPEMDPSVRQAVEQTMAQASQMAWSVSPSPRLSQPLVQHFLHDQGAKVRLSLLRIPAQRSMDKFPEPSLAELESLFQQYKQVLPGEGQPYGFGYRQPNRVKLEYLELPAAALLAATKVDEADALAHYLANQQKYVSPATQAIATPATQATALTYAQVRSQIISELREARARELGDRMLKEAQGLLLDDARQLSDVAGYRDTAGWEPMSLAKLAAELQERFGVLPTVVRLDGQWLTAKELAQLSGIGNSRIHEGTRSTRRNQVTFSDYVMSARELSPAPENALLTLRLQTRLASVPMIDDAGHRYLFRLIDAQPARSPDSIEEVRPQVVRDARLLMAYQSLVQDTLAWTQRLEHQTLEDLAQDLGLMRRMTGFFPRRNVTGVSLSVPEIPGLGPDDAFTDQTFIDTVFDRAEALAQAGPISHQDRGQRSLAIPVAQKLSLYLVTIEDYLPMNQREYDQTLTMYPQIPMWIYQLMMDGQSMDPLALGPLKMRTGFVSEGRDAQESMDP